MGWRAAREKEEEKNGRGRRDETARGRMQRATWSIDDDC
jgi:hypothetical protein